MAKVRISGFGSGFELENELVGIGTDNPTNTLQALGNIHATNAKAVGVSTFTTFDGFVDTKAAISGAGGAKSGATSGEIIIEGEVTVSTGTTFTSGPENLTVTDNFTLPGISDDKPTVGTTRFNEDLASLEFYTGVEWKAVNSRVDSGSSGRGVFGGGCNLSAPSGDNHIEYIQIHTKGNSRDFGVLTVAAGFAAAVSSSTRGIWGSRYTGSGNDTIDYVTIASQGDAIDFGNSTGSVWSRGGFSSSTRGIFFGGNPSTNVIEYVQIDTVGNALDFGDLMSSRRDAAGFASATRGIMSGGQPGIGNNYEVIESITIASKGNSVRFGEKNGIGMMAGTSNATRGIFAGGTHVPAIDGHKNIDFVTIASEGNAITFGDLTTTTYRFCAMGSQTRAVFAHGTGTPGNSIRESMDYITIASQGDAIDFGDKSATREYADGGCSDSHGGLGGF